MALSSVEAMRHHDASRDMHQLGNQLFALATNLTVVCATAAECRPGSSTYIEVAELFESARLIHQLRTSVLKAEPIDLMDGPIDAFSAGTPVTRTFPYHEVFLLHLLQGQWNQLLGSSADRLAQCDWLTSTAVLLRELHAGASVDLGTVRQLTELMVRLHHRARLLERSGEFEQLYSGRV